MPETAAAPDGHRTDLDLPVHACDGAVRQAFELLGKRWNGVILATLAGGALGFAELRRAVAGISDSVLSGRLADLAGAGLVERVVDAGPPVTVSYDLSDAGRALVPSLESLAAWASAHLVLERPTTGC